MIAPCPHLYEAIFCKLFAENRQMAFLSGPRPLGKTSLARALADRYLDGDSDDDRAAIVAGQNAVVAMAGLDDTAPSPPRLVPALTFLSQLL